MIRIDPANEAAVQWLFRGMEQQKITQQVMADTLGVEQSRISELKRGKRRLQLSEIQDASKIIREPPPVAGTGERIKIAGRVKAGAYAPPDEEQQWIEDWITLPQSNIHPEVPKFALKVEGTSMDRRYPEGTLLICARLGDLDEDPVAGKRYIVRRTLVDGQIENTVKELAPDSAGNLWLWPRSNDPEWTQPISLVGKDGETIEIWAKVLWAFTPD